MTNKTFQFGFSLRFRNKREPTVPYEKVLKQAGVEGTTFSHSQLGVLGVGFSRSAPSQEEAVRVAADDLLRAIPDAILFEAMPGKVDRMAVRRAMMGFAMPWRFLDQGLPELETGGLINYEARRMRA